MPTIKVILNPASGSGTGRNATEAIRQTLAEANAKFEIIETTGPLSAVAQAAQAVREGWEIIAAVGGDGVVNEVLNGMIEAAQSTPDWEAGQPVSALGLIPVGTGNDYAFSIGVPARDPAAACRLLLAGRTRKVDIGRVEDEQGHVRHFCNNCGAGFDAATTVESYSLRFMRGSLIFLIAVVKTIFKYFKAPVMTVRYNDQEHTMPMLMASVANGRRTGGMFMMAPQAIVDDGLLEVTLARQVSQLGIFRLLPHFIRGTHATQAAVTVDQATHVVIASEEGLPVHLDGEIMRTDAHRLEVCVLPGRLRVVF